MFGAALNLPYNTGRLQFVFQNCNQFGNVALTIFQAFIQTLGNVFIGFWFNNSEGEVFQFPLQLPNTQAIG